MKKSNISYNAQRGCARLKDFMPDSEITTKEATEELAEEKLEEVDDAQ